MNKPSKLSVEAWAIRNKETGEYFVAASGKNAWRSKGAAKNAWANTWLNTYYRSEDEVRANCDKAKVKPVLNEKPYPKWEITFPYFDQQDQWELVELSGKVEDTGKRVKMAEELLQECANQELLPADLKQRVEDFLDATN